MVAALVVSDTASVGAGVDFSTELDAVSPGGWADVSAPPELSTFIVGRRSLAGVVSPFAGDPSVCVSVAAVGDGACGSGFVVSGFVASEPSVLVSGDVLGPGDAEAPGSDSESG